MGAKTETVGRGQQCRYTCQDNGGCRVKFDSDRPISGTSGGSCFNEEFGGSCIGTPARCKECNKVVNCPQPSVGSGGSSSFGGGFGGSSSFGGGFGGSFSGSSGSSSGNNFGGGGSSCSKTDSD